MYQIRLPTKVFVALWKKISSASYTTKKYLFLWSGWPDLNRHGVTTNGFSYYSMSPWPAYSCCSLDYVFTIPAAAGLGSQCIVSTHLQHFMLTQLGVVPKGYPPNQLAFTQRVSYSGAPVQDLGFLPLQFSVQE